MQSFLAYQKKTNNKTNLLLVPVKVLEVSGREGWVLRQPQGGGGSAWTVLGREGLVPIPVQSRGGSVWS